MSKIEATKKMSDAISEDKYDESPTPVESPTEEEDAGVAASDVASTAASAPSCAVVFAAPTASVDDKEKMSISESTTSSKRSSRILGNGKNISTSHLRLSRNNESGPRINEETLKVRFGDDISFAKTGRFWYLSLVQFRTICRVCLL